MEGKLKIKCAKCGKVLMVSKEARGKKGKCPGCGNVIIINIPKIPLEFICLVAGIAIVAVVAIILFMRLGGSKKQDEAVVVIHEKLTADLLHALKYEKEKKYSAAILHYRNVSKKMSEEKLELDDEEYKEMLEEISNDISLIEYSREVSELLQNPEQNIRRKIETLSKLEEEKFEREQLARGLVKHQGEWITKEEKFEREQSEAERIAKEAEEVRRRKREAKRIAKEAEEVRRRKREAKRIAKENIVGEWGDKGGYVSLTLEKGGTGWLFLFSRGGGSGLFNGGGISWKSTGKRITFTGASGQGVGVILNGKKLSVTIKGEEWILFR